MSRDVLNILNILVAQKLPSINQQPITSNLEPNESGSEEERSEEQEIYQVDKLNVGQRRIFDYIHENPDHTIIIQGQPGMGKTFTLMTIGHAWESPVNAINYKHDLLRPFKYIAHRYTVAKFMMSLWNLEYEEYLCLECALSTDLNGLQLATCMVTLLSSAQMPDFKGSLVILDEYTMIPKPLFLLTLTLLRYYKIGTVICGDRNQLESIHNSCYIDCSSFDIASRYAHAVFELDGNEHCPDRRYNDIIKYVSRFASEQDLDAYAYTILAAIVPRQLYGTTVFSDIHLAARHRHLTSTAHKQVIQENIPQSLYSIKRDSPTIQHDIARDNSALHYCSHQSGSAEFLRYLPLAVGTLYYVYKQSEECHGILTDVDQENEILRLQMQTTSGEEIVKKDTCDDVMFRRHRKALLDTNGPGKVYNYPIYPANIMTFHKCQGCTVKEKLDIDLQDATYRQMYVALSRVDSPKHIVRVIVPNYIAHLVSTIVCFYEHTTGEEITADTIDVRINNYNVYDVRDTDNYIGMVEEFFNAETIERRSALRDELIDTLNRARIRSFIVEPSLRMETDISGTFMQKFIDYLPVFVALSQVDEIERHVWLHEFALRTSNMPMLRDELKYETNRDYHPILNNLAGLNNLCSLKQSSIEHIEYHKRLESGKVRVTRSRFVFKVHEKLMQCRDDDQRESAITPDWLIFQLCDMMRS